MSGNIFDNRRLYAVDDYTSPEVLYDNLIEIVKRYHPSDDISLIEKAYRVAGEARIRIS